jgi:hypothetical protein
VSGTDGIVKLSVNFTEGDAYIDNDNEEQDYTYLIIAYLLFLSQFFYSCDKRQITPVSDSLSKIIEQNEDRFLIVNSIMRSVYNTFSRAEKDAYDGTFRYPDNPPAYYISGPAPIRPKAKYSLVTYTREKHWLMDLRVSFRLNIVYFPVTVGLLYIYTCVEIGDDNILLFDSCVTQFLQLMNSVDFRSRNEGAYSTVANLVIAKNIGKNI